MANAARRAQLLTNGSLVEPDKRVDQGERVDRGKRVDQGKRVDRGNDDTGERRLVARATLGRRDPSATAPPARRSQSSRGTGGPMAPDVDRAAPAAWQTRRRSPSSPRMRKMLVAAVIVAAVVAGAGIALGMALRSPTKTAATGAGANRHSSSTPQHGTVPRAAPSGSSGKSLHTTAGATGVAPATTVPPTTVPPTTVPPTTVPATTVPPTTVPTASAGVPKLSSASPSAGAAGQTVVISGSGLYSSTGQVVAYFGGSSAPTSCSSQTSCTVTVPDLGTSPSTVPLTIVTTQGRSNALTFAYT